MTSTAQHRHGVASLRAAFTAPTHTVLNWLADHGLCPTYSKHWDSPPTLCVEFGHGSGWLWGTLDISGTTGRLKHLKAFSINDEGVQELRTADGPAHIRAELECHAGHRVERIAQLAARHGLLALPTSTPEALYAAVAQFGSDARAQLMDALRAARSAEHRLAILREIREVLQEDAPDRTPVGVVFATREFDGSYFLVAEDGDVVFADGTTDRFDFGDLSDTLTAEYGDDHGEKFTLGVDLRTDELEADDYSSDTSIHERFSVPKPPPAPRTALQIISGTAETDAQATPAELDALAEHVHQYGPNDFLSVAVEVRFPTVYAAAIAQLAQTGQTVTGAAPDTTSDQESTP